MISSIFLAVALQQQTPFPFSHRVLSTGEVAEGKTHRVAPGDTLSAIAPQMGESWQQLYVNNKSVIGDNPNLIYVGEMLHAGPSVTARAIGEATAAAAPAPPAPPVHHAVAASGQQAVQQTTYTGSSGGIYSYTAIESLWESAGGPSWAAPHAASIAECESGGNPDAYNPSGATGIFQILGSVVPGDLRNPYVNALNAVAKFKASGDTFAQWVCT
jgi:hypothetical protein